MANINRVHFDLDQGVDGVLPSPISYVHNVLYILCRIWCDEDVDCMDEGFKDGAYRIECTFYHGVHGLRIVIRNTES